jgi:Protein of unknown function (DUF4238)
MKRTNLDKKRHHYVPVIYLKGFCDDFGRVVAYRKDEPDKPLYVRPTEIAFEKYYYSQPLPGGGQENHRFEDLFASVETHWPRVRAAARAGAFDTEVLHWLYAFMTMMRARVPAARDFHESAMALKMRIETKALASMGKLPAELLRYEHELDTVDITVNRHRTIHTMSEDMRALADMTLLLGFEILLNETDLDFISSDNPVVYFDPSKPSPEVTPYDVDRKVELYFPLDARTLLRGSHRLRTRGQIPRVRSLTDKMRVRAINRTIAQFGYRFMFANDRTHDALALAHAARSPVLDAEVRKPSTREIEIHLRHKFGSRPKLLKFDPKKCEGEVRPNSSKICAP